MRRDTTQIVKLFYSYAHQDKALRDELAKQLDRHYILDWHDRDIVPGMDWAREIDEQLNEADIVLLLISPDFKASNYCTGIEMIRALERQATGEAIVIPIQLRTVDWEEPPFASLQTLPDGGRPANAWIDRDAAFANIAAGIHRAAKGLQKRQETLEAKSKYIASADVYMAAKNYNAAVAEYRRAMSTPPHDASLYHKLGKALMYVGDLPKALQSFEQAIKLSPENAVLYAEKGVILYSLKKYDLALNAYQDALERDDRNIQIYRWKSQALVALRKFDEARVVYVEAIRRDQSNALLRKEYGDILVELGLLTDARAAYDKAVALNENFGSAYQARSNVLERLSKQAYHDYKEFTDLAKRDQAKVKKLSEENG